MATCQLAYQQEDDIECLDDLIQISNLLNIQVTVTKKRIALAILVFFVQYIYMEPNEVREWPIGHCKAKIANISIIN